MDRQQVWILRGLNLGLYFTMGVLQPFLPLYFSMKGYNPAEIGLFMVAGPFLAVFSQPLWGFVSDRLRSVKGIVISLWIMSVLCSIWLFHAEGFWMTLLAVSALFFFKMPSLPLMDSAAVLVSQEAGVSYGSIRLWGSIGFAVVSIASGYLIVFAGGIGNIPFLYWSFWVLPLILIFFLKDRQAAAKPIHLRSLKEVVGKEFAWLLFIVLLISSAHRASDSLLPVFLESLGGTEEMVSWAFGLAALFEIAAFVIVPRFLGRFHELGLLAIAASLYSIRWLLYSLIGNPAVIMALQVLHAATFGIYWIVLIQYVGRIVPQHFRSTGIAVMTAVHGGVAALIGGYGGGLVMDRFGADVMYWVGAIFAGTGAVLLFISRWRQKIRSA